ncbi:MAG: F0F1 ATP synthase subunit A [candidate division Zixibacteria bacterium]
MNSLLSFILVSSNQQGHDAADTASSAVGNATEHAVGAAEHGAEAAAALSPEFPNIIEILNHYIGSDFTRFLFDFRIVVFSLVVGAILSILAIAASRKRSLIPGPLQNFAEWVVEGLSNMIVTVLGEQGRKYVPFLGTLFIYIFCMNVFGLIPGMFSSTSKLNTTLGLAICVFLYVQFTGIRNFGVFGYIYHLMGSPKSIIEWCLVPLNLPLHIIGELAKPVSLSLRLFGNISGEDMLLAIFATLGVAIMSFMHLPIGIPLHLPFLFLALLTSFVQALVFTLLATIYFSLMSHHEEESH